MKRINRARLSRILGGDGEITLELGPAELADLQLFNPGIEIETVLVDAPQSLPAGVGMKIAVGRVSMNLCGCKPREAATQIRLPKIGS